MTNKVSYVTNPFVMQLTNSGEYAIRAMVNLASARSGVQVLISQLAFDCDIPESFLRKIIPSLTRSGLIISSRGTGGGVKLSKPADAISLLDIIEAVEGKLYFNKCLLNTDICDRTDWCEVHLVWIEVQNTVKEILSKKSLTEIVNANTFRRDRI